MSIIPSNLHLRKLSVTKALAVGKKKNDLNCILDVVGDIKTTGSLTVGGNFNINGITTTTNNEIVISEQILLTNTGTGPALFVKQTGANDIADFLDESGSIFKIADSGQITIGGTGSGSLPNKVSISGNLSASGLHTCISDSINTSSSIIAASTTAVKAAYDLASLICITALVLPYAGVNAPNGWVFCYGQAISRTTYSALFVVIGSTYGNGDGSTTFNVPDMRGRVIAGVDNMGGTAAGRISAFSATSVGASGGADTVTLTSDQSGLPAHNHGITDGGHSHSASQPAHNHGVSDPGHRHGLDGPNTYGNEVAYPYQTTSTFRYGNSSTSTISLNSSTIAISATGISINNATPSVTVNSGTTGVSVNNATPSVTVNSGTTGVSVNNNGATNATSSHLNVQPTIMLNYIIKY